MLETEVHVPLLLFLTFLGLAVAILSALENRVQWIASLCAFFGEGCRRTAEFTLLTIPIAWWGIGYYLLLGGVVIGIRPLVFWTVMAGIGVEVTFLKIMATIRAFCIFCLLNAVVVVLLFLAVFDAARLWEALSIILLAFMVSDYLISRENRAKTAAAPEMEATTAIAEIDGEEIPAEKVEKPLAGRIYELKFQMYKLKRERLDEIITKRLVQKEADRKGVSAQELVNSVMSEQKKEKDTGPGPMETLPTTDRAEDALKEYAETLRDRYEVKLYLEEPDLPFAEVSLEGSPTQGSADAAVTVVEFSDYLCPACRQAHEITKEIKDQYAGKIRWVFKDFPLPAHEGADFLAVAARCAGEQGKFWEYQDKLFTAEEPPNTEQLKAFAEKLNLNLDEFAKCLEKEPHRSQVESDVEEAKEAGISATPTFLINGRMKTGAPSVEEFGKMIDEELEKATA